MTRFFTIQILLAGFFMTAVTTEVNASSKSQFHGHMISVETVVPPTPGPGTITGMDLPAIGIKSTPHKLHLLKIEELGKLHRFHKERVKKVKKHHSKLWLIAKIIVICCQIALLIHAYLHLSH